jgi:hypothetical protein
MSPNALLPETLPTRTSSTVSRHPRRRRRSVLFGLIILLLLAGGGVASLVILLQHEPTFYRRAAVPPGPERRSLCLACAGHAISLKGAIQRQSDWDQEFSEEQINSLLEEGLRDPNFLKELKDNGIQFTLPADITDPRIAFEAGCIRLGFRYHLGRFSTVVSIALRVWVPKAESNVMAVEIQGMRAGAVPISAQSILEHLSAVAESNNIKLSWYRHDGNPVAILHFQSEQGTRVKLENFDPHPGKLFIKGTSQDAVSAAPDANR